MLAVAFLCFAFARMAYLILWDDYLGYLYQLHYPILSRSIELIYADLVDYTDPFLDIMPKDRYEIPQILPRLYELVVQKEKRVA
jgi:hypothetical protein